MRREKTKRFDLQKQIQTAMQGILDEPHWPGAPSFNEVKEASQTFDAQVEALYQLEFQTRMARLEVLETQKKVREIMRRIDLVTSSLYGEDGFNKTHFGLRPIDKKRNSPGPTPPVVKLVLSDGGAAGAIALDWKRVPRATYEVQWYGDERLVTLLGAAVATRSEFLIPALPPGLQIWVRVRALRGGRYGDWSETATRIANV